MVVLLTPIVLMVVGIPGYIYNNDINNYDVKIIIFNIICKTTTKRDVNIIHISYFL